MEDSDDPIGFDADGVARSVTPRVVSAAAPTTTASSGSALALDRSCLAVQNDLRTLAVRWTIIAWVKTVATANTVARSPRRLDRT